MKQALLSPLDLRYATAPDDMCAPWAGRVLGRVSYGAVGVSNPDCMGGVPLDVLPHGGSIDSAWFGAGPVIAGSCGALQYRHDDFSLFGYISVNEADFAPQDGCSPLQQASEAVYAAIFACLEKTGFKHLARCWNYLPRINVDGGGLERYRQFNIGRQNAFIAARRSYLAGSPSACALGTAEGSLVAYFIASHVEPQAVENPRQVSAYRYPERYGPRSPTFSRASLLALPGEDVLFISGTASIVGHETVHMGDVRAQTEETLRNLAAVVEQANLKSALGGFALKDLFMKVFVRHPEDQPAVAAVLRQELPVLHEPMWLQADICRAELLVEIEAFGFRCVSCI